MRESAAALVIFDLSKPIIGESLRYWVNLLHTYAPSDLQLWIVGNKQDLLTNETHSEFQE